MISGKIGRWRQVNKAGLFAMVAWRNINIIDPEPHDRDLWNYMDVYIVSLHLMMMVAGDIYDVRLISGP